MFFKGPYGVMLLMFVSLDANNSLYTLALAWCEGKNGDLWIWFLTLLSDG